MWWDWRQYVGIIASGKPLSLVSAFPSGKKVYIVENKLVKFQPSRKCAVWRTISALTRARHHTSVRSVDEGSLIAPTWDNTCCVTREWSHSRASSALRLSALKVPEIVNLVTDLLTTNRELKQLSNLCTYFQVKWQHIRWLTQVHIHTSVRSAAPPSPSPRPSRSTPLSTRGCGPMGATRVWCGKCTVTLETKV